MKHSIAVIAVLAAACTAKTPAASSSAVLAPEQTWLIVAKPARPAALDIVRMFNQRGFALSDMRTDDRGVTLRFQGERTTVAEPVVTALDVIIAVGDIVEAVDDAKHKRPHRHHHYEPSLETYELGSVYYVRVEPRGETMTSIAAVGRPTRSGIEACTNDGDEIAGPCLPLKAGPMVAPEVSGFAEAELINGVFAEIRLEGNVVSADPEVTIGMRRCLERQREVFAAAARVSSQRAKKGILRTRPVCAGAPPLAAN